jgi:uncharacterized protein YdaU (DUF1376 family)
MHYYQHNIADYRKDTSHLSLLEHGIYRQLLDSYYLDEKPLPVDINKIMRSHSIRNADEEQSLKNVLSDFFELTKKGYIHKRCDETISQYHGKSDKARASALARWGNKDKAVHAVALNPHTERNANHKPITNNHKPIIKITTPDGVSESVFNDYKKLREKKKAPITETALKGLEREAKKADLSLQSVMELCCERGWSGFKAEWIKVEETKSKELPLGTDQQIEAAYRAECGDPAKSRFNSYYEMKNFVIANREKRKLVK